VNKRECLTLEIAKTGIASTEGGFGEKSEKKNVSEKSWIPIWELLRKQEISETSLNWLTQRNM